MVNERSIESVLSKRFGPNEEFIRPDYEGYCFSGIPHTVESVLTGTASESILPEGVLPAGSLPQKVVVIFVDGFGWRTLQRHQANSPFLQRALRDATVSMLASQFPSTTSAHVASLATGLTPAEHGLFEWNLYIPGNDSVMCPLPFHLVGADGVKRSVDESVVDPSVIYPRETFYQRLSRSGIASIIISPKKIVESVSTRYLGRGAVARWGFDSLNHLRENWSTFTGAQAWDYCLLYLDKFDSVSHEHGPESELADAYIMSLLDTLDSITSNPANQDILFLITADHGQIEVQPREHYLQVVDELPWLADVTRKHADGRMINPSGGLRNLFLHIEDEVARQVVDQVNATCSEYLHAFLTQELFEQRIFGRTSSSLHRDRIGSVSLIPKGHSALFWGNTNTRLRDNKGHHGGGSLQEVCIPLIALRS